MDVVALTRDREADWQAFVDASPHTSVGHCLGWRNAVARTYAHVPHFLMAMDGARVRGVLPLFLIRHPVMRRALVTAPFLSHAGLCADSDEAAIGLVEASRALCAETRAGYVEIRSLDKQDRGLAIKDAYCTYVLRLPRDPDALWRRLDRRARTAVRKALKCGLTVERGHHLLRPFADVLSRHMQSLGTPFHGEAFYRHILEELADRADIFAVRLGDRVVGGALTLMTTTTISGLYGGCLKEHRDLAGMNLLTWEIIRHGCERGMAWLDLGRSRWESGGALFKDQWKAEPRPLFYEYHLPRGGDMPDLDPTNPRFRLAIAAWKRLPMAVARALGPHVINGIP